MTPEISNLKEILLSRTIGEIANQSLSDLSGFYSPTLVTQVNNEIKQLREELVQQYGQIEAAIKDLVEDLNTSEEVRKCTMAILILATTEYGKYRLDEIVPPQRAAVLIEEMFRLKPDEDGNYETTGGEDNTTVSEMDSALIEALSAFFEKFETASSRNAGDDEAEGEGEGEGIALSSSDQAKFKAAADYLQKQLQDLSQQGNEVELRSSWQRLKEKLGKNTHALLDEISESVPAARNLARFPTTSNSNLNVLSSLLYQALREAIWKNTFRLEGDNPWPTAKLQKGSTSGEAQLRPPMLENQLFVSPENIETWSQIMRKQRQELSDLDTDALDLLGHVWLQQAKTPNDYAVANVDDLLAMRGLKPKLGGQGRRGGFNPDQRQQMLKALSHIQNLWLNITEVEIYNQPPQSVSPPVEELVVVEEKNDDDDDDGETTNKTTGPNAHRGPTTTTASHRSPALIAFLTRQK